MKNLLLIILISVFAASCTKEKAAEVIPTIIGKWQLVQSSQKDYKNGVLINTLIKTGKANEYWLFNADLSGSAVEDSQSYTFTYTLSSKILSITLPSSGGNPTYVDISTYTVTELSANKLVIYREFLGDQGQKEEDETTLIKE